MSNPCKNITEGPSMFDDEECTPGDSPPPGVSWRAFILEQCLDPGDDCSPCDLLMTAGLKSYSAPKRNRRRKK
jgi:hypothetical protein